VKQIYGRPGMAKTFTVNGELRTMKGETPKTASVELNGEKVTLDTPVKEGDKIVFYPAVDGKDASKTLGDVLLLPKILLNGEETPLPATVTVNGAPARLETPLEDRAEVEYSVITGLREVLAYYQKNISGAAEREIHVDVDGEDIALTAKRYTLCVNGIAVSPDEARTLAETDAVEFKEMEPQWRLKDVISPPSHGRDLRIRINGEEYMFPGGKGKLLRNGEDAAPDDLLHDGDIVRSLMGKDAEAVLVDIFRYISVAPQDQIGKRMKLFIDGQESQFTSPLHDNAEVNVLFE